MRISDWSSDVCSSDLVPEAESNRALLRDWGRNRLEPPAPDCCQCSIFENSGGFRVDYARCTDRSVGCDDEFDQYPSVLARLFRGDRIPGRGCFDRMQFVRGLVACNGLVPLAIRFSAACCSTA